MAEIIERALAYSVRARQQTISEMLNERRHQPLHQRALKTTFYKTAGRAALDLLVGDFANDPKFIASGSEQIVFEGSDEQEVTKLLVSTIGQSQANAQIKANYHQELSDLACSYMGEFWTPTEFAVRPIKLGRYVVAAAQPKIDFYPEVQDVESIWEFSKDAGFVRHQKQFLTSIANLYSSTGLMPDFGEGNIVVVGSEEGARIKIIDTIPETPKKLVRPMWNNRSISREQANKIVIGLWLDRLDEGDLKAA
jgi:uncharacterized membrane-anchored protein YhcB (DUF1043 family)